MPEQLECDWCHKKLERSEARFVPKWVYWPAVIATAFFHGGLWFQDDLAHPYCRTHWRCMLMLMTFFTLVVYSGATLGIFLWLRWT